LRSPFGWPQLEYIALRILTFTTLFPSASRPRHGIFVEQRLRQLMRTGEVQARVVAPVPWFPLSHPRYGKYAAFARTPHREERHGIAIAHPRYPVIPKIGDSCAALLLMRWTERTVREALRDQDFALIDAHFLYPDGVAAVLVAQKLRKPVVVTARGSDVDVLPRQPLIRWMIRWTAARASAVVTVSAALGSSLVGLGVAPDKITVLRNGVDLDVFQPGDREDARRRWGFSGPALLSVGHLVPDKGHDVFLKAVARLPTAQALIVGEGREESALRRLTASLGIADRVRFQNELPQDQLRSCYAAADVLVLATAHEGWPNVLLEAMACGTPVVATRVGGIPEIVQAPEAGRLVEQRTPEAVADAIRSLLESGVDRMATRAYAEKFGWESTTRGQLALFRRVLEAG
jgi:glycosyltransferase involved in cell wall biosynthesis